MNRWSYVNKTRLVLLLALMFTALGAGVFRTSSILFMAATLCGAPLVGIAVVRFASGGLRISRQMPTSSMVGDVVRVRFTVTNAGWCPAFLVHARSLCFDAAPEAKVGRGQRKQYLLEAKTTRERLESAILPLGDFEAGKNSIDKALKAQKTGEGDAEFVLPMVGPGAHFTGESYWKLMRRGRYQVPGAGAGAFDPIGLFSDFTARNAAQTLVVMPRPLKLHRLELLAGSDGTQQPRGSASVADAAEMNGVRPYRPGEGMRRIHWKATARSNVLHVVEWEEETASGVTLLLDTQAAQIYGPEGANTLEMSILAAASVASYTLENGQRVAMFWWEKGATGAPQLGYVEGRHRGALASVLTALALIDPCDHEDATLPNLAREVAVQGQWSGGILVLGSDRCDWGKAWQGNFSQGVRRGLAFDSASFANPTPDLGASEKTPVGSPVTVALPPGVRRVRRGEALSGVLEHGH